LYIVTDLGDSFIYVGLILYTEFIPCIGPVHCERSCRGLGHHRSGGGQSHCIDQYRLHWYIF